MRACARTPVGEESNLNFEELKLKLPLFQSSGDWLAVIPEGRLSIFYEFDQWHYNIQGRLPSGEAKVIQGGCEESIDDVARKVWEGVLELREECAELKTDDVLNIVKSFMEGPLRAYLVEGVTFSRFVEMTNAAFGTKIKYRDLYPTWLFNARATWDWDAEQEP